MTTSKRDKTGFAGFVNHPPSGDEFALPVGKFIVNFGAVEFLSILWIKEMTRDPLLLDVAVDLPLSKRIPLILSLSERERIPGAWARRVATAWKSVAQLAEIRNFVAHGPVLHAWKGRPAEGLADVVGVAGLRFAKQKYGRKLPSVTVPLLVRAVNEAAALAKELDALLSEHRTHRGSPHPNSDADNKL